MATIDPNSPITRFTSVAFVNDPSNPFVGMYTPQVTNAQLNALTPDDDMKGGVVFDLDTEELMTYSAAGHWIPILTEGSDLNLTNITCVSITASSFGAFDSITSNTITNAHTINTDNLNVNSTTATGTLGVTGMLTVQGNTVLQGSTTHVEGNIIVDGAADLTTGGVSGDFGVNGALTAGSLGVIGNVLIDGSTQLQNLTTPGTITSTGTFLFNNCSGFMINANDFGTRIARIEELLYGVTNLLGASPITASADVGAGTGAVFTITGSVLGGKIKLHTGTSPALGVIATFTIPSDLLPYLTGDWSVVMSPGSVTTAQYETTSKTYISVGGGSNLFIMGSSNTPLAASTDYFWNYMVVGNILGT
jgi:hypothetical protein